MKMDIGYYLIQASHIKGKYLRIVSDKGTPTVHGGWRHFRTWKRECPGAHRAHPWAGPLTADADSLRVWEPQKVYRYQPHGHASNTADKMPNYMPQIRSVYKAKLMVPNKWEVTGSSSSLYKFARTADFIIIITTHFIKIANINFKGP